MLPRRLGRSSAADAPLEAAKSNASPPLPPDVLETPEPAPIKGIQPWGSWANGAAAVSLELVLPEGVRGRDVVCETAEGWLCVQLDISATHMYEDGVWGGEEVVDEGAGRPPLLFGRFAQNVVGSELSWCIEDDGDRKLLHIELPKAPPDPRSRASADCLFDETLTINGESCLAPGLSQGTLTLQMPKELQ